MQCFAAGINSAVLVDLVGRKTILCTCFFGAAFATAVFASFDQPAWLFVSVGLMYFNTEHVYVWSTITTYSSEVFPTNIRNQAVGLIHGLAVMGAITNVILTPILMESDTQLPFLINAIVFALGGVIACFLRIETSHKALD